MATVKGTFYNFTIPPAPVGSNRDITPVFIETFTPGATGDNRRLIKIPINVACGAGTFFQVSDMDTNATPTLVLTLRITDGTTTKILIHESTIGQTGGIARPTKIPATENGIGFITNTNNYWLDLLYTTGAATGASGTFVYGLHMVGWHATGVKS